MNLGFNPNPTGPGSMLDSVLQMAVPGYGIMRNISAAFEPEYRQGTLVGHGIDAYNQIQQGEGLFGNLFGSDPAEIGYTDMGGYGYNTYDVGNGYTVGVEDPGLSYDTGSYTDTGSYGFGTVDGVGVEDPDY